MKIIYFATWKGRRIRIKGNNNTMIAVRQELDGVSLSVSFEDSPPGDSLTQIRKILLASYADNLKSFDRLTEGGVR